MKLSRKFGGKMKLSLGFFEFKKKWKCPSPFIVLLLFWFIKILTPKEEIVKSGWKKWRPGGKLKIKKGWGAF